MKNFLNRMKNHTNSLNNAMVDYLFDSKFVIYMEQKANNSKAWDILGWVFSLTICVVTYLPIRVIAFFKAFKKEEV